MNGNTKLVNSAMAIGLCYGIYRFAGDKVWLKAGACGMAAVIAGKNLPILSQALA